MAYNSSNRSERLLQGRRFTTDNLTLSQEAFTDVFDLGASEIYTDDGLIPTGSSQLAYSGSSQNGAVVSGSVINPSISTDVNVLKYHYRKKLKAASDGQREVYYFTTSDPSSVSDTVTSDQLIETDQQTSFVSPKYIIASDSPNNTEANPPGYKVVVFKDTASSAGSITSDPADPSTYVFDFKTGILTWTSGNAPASNQFVYISVYQYVGRTLRSQIDDGSISNSGSFASRVTNLKTDSGSFSTRVTNLKTDSGSFSDRVTLTEASASRTNVTFLNVSSSRVTASELLVNESTRVNGSFAYNGLALFEDNIIVRSGSTIFGSGSMPSDVTHQFTGSIFNTGSIDVDGRVTATSFNGIFEGVISSSAQLSTNFLSSTAFTAPGISGSWQGQSFISASQVQENIGGGVISSSAQLATVISGSWQGQSFISASQVQENIGGGVVSASAQLASVISGSWQGQSFISASQVQENIGGGVVSASAQLATVISGSWQGQSFISGSQVTENLPTGIISSSQHIFTAITSSGDISASGNTFLNLTEDATTTFKTVVVDPDTGRLYRTGSYGGGGGGSDADFSAVGEDILPDGTHNLGAFDKKWQAIFAEDTFFGGIHEINLETKGLDQLQPGTVLVSKAGKMVPCTTEADSLIMGIVSSGHNFPIILGAEPVLVNGPVYEGDYIITSNIIGHGKAVNPSKIFELQLFGKIIAQSLETKTEGGLIRAMIRKM